MADGDRYRLDDFPLPAALGSGIRCRCVGDTLNLDQLEKQMIERALRMHHFNVSLAAVRARPLAWRALPAHGEAWTLGASSNSGWRGERSFSIGAILLVVKAAQTPGVRAGLVVAALVGIAALASLWNFIRRTNFLVSRFVESVRFEDYSQRFSDPSGGGFDVLGQTLDQALKTLQARHTQGERRSALSRGDRRRCAKRAAHRRCDGSVEVLNKAARQLFARQPLQPDEGPRSLGPSSPRQFDLPPGTRKITRLILDGVPQKAIFASAQVARLDQPVTVLSILPVQSELGALEVAAQADLVRVLTHEIMNSLTPVTSLARTGAELVATAAEARQIELADAKSATETVARRAEGILRFVESYREFAQAPDVHRRQFKAKPWAEEIMRLALANASRTRDRSTSRCRAKDA